MDYPYYPGLIGGSNTTSDVHISTGNAETIAAFFTCLRIKAETAASINTYVHKLEDQKTLRDKNHPIDYLLSAKPNRLMNAWSFWYTMQYLEDLWGNSYAEIKRSRGEVYALDLLPSWDVIPKMVDNSIFYDYKGRIIPARNMIHFKQNSLDGLVGRSIISLQRDQLGLAKKQENYAAKSVGNKPPMLFEDGQNLDSKTVAEMSQAFQDHVKKGIPPVLWGGLKFRNVLMPAGDLQLFEMKGVTTADIYAMFRMPQSKGGNYSRESGATFNNVEQQNINFVQDVVIPSVTQKENECNVKLFTREEYSQYQVHFDLSDLMKSDLKTQAEFYDKAWSKGWYSADEIRKKFGDNPIGDEHGRRYYVQGAFIPVDKIDQFYENKNTNKREEWADY